MTTDEEQIVLGFIHAFAEVPISDMPNQECIFHCNGYIEDVPGWKNAIFQRYRHAQDCPFWWAILLKEKQKERKQ